MKPDEDFEEFVKSHPAAFRRLCVETSRRRKQSDKDGPAAFRRLCVETRLMPLSANADRTSRLQAAVC